MTFLQIIINDVFLLALILGLLFYIVITQRRVEMKIANLAAEYDLLQGAEEDTDHKEGNMGETSNDKTEDFITFQESVNKRLDENEEELKKVIEVLRTVTLEIKSLKDAVRERTVDLEL